MGDFIIKTMTKNPRWHRDELILTLNLYFNLSHNFHIKTNPNIIELSNYLNKLPIHSEELRKANFRSPSGVAMKLGNLKAVDPNIIGGLTSFSKSDESIFFEFQDRKEELRRIADLILESLEDKEVITALYKIEDDSTATVKEGYEGELIYRLHKVRERDVKLVETKKKTVLRSTGKLACEVCDFDFHKSYGDLGKGFIECHHNKPLSSYTVKQKTSIVDLALVCSNCHRMLHRNRENMTIEGLRGVLNQ